MNISTTLIPKSFSGNNSWALIDTIDSMAPKIFEMFDLVASPTYSFTDMAGFKEKDDSYKVEFELPRFKKENIKITAENSVIHVSAEQDNLKFYHSVSIPTTLDTSSITAELDHGVLSILGQKSEAAKPKNITIK
jgi:HSP20 family molecular chaperone IbpA